MNDSAVDEIGIRGFGGGNLVYTNGQLFSWFGSGIMDKPIGDFTPSPYGDSSLGFSSIQTTADRPYFALTGAHININSRIIPEPEQYALVFGLLALAFVIVRRRFQKKELRNEQ